MSAVNCKQCRLLFLSFSFLENTSLCDNCHVKSNQMASFRCASCHYLIFDVPHPNEQAGPRICSICKINQHLEEYGTAVERAQVRRPRAETQNGLSSV